MTRPIRAAIEHLRKAFGPGEAGGLTDAELLRRWVAGRDEAAFEVLLWRHGPMVLGVCRRLLRRAQDIEDAFQATFLAFVRKCAGIRRGQAVGAWLYRVAYRVALRARASAPEAPAPPGVEPADPADSACRNDLRAALDQEVGRLPERYRVPLVLCYFEGRTNEEAARELGCPVGTVLSRLSRARERLRVRLTRRGLALPAGLFATVLSVQAGSAGVPARLVFAARQAALVAAGGSAGAVSAPVAALVNGVCKEMAMTKLKIVVALVVATGLAGTGAGVWAYRPSGEPPPRAVAREKALESAKPGKPRPAAPRKEEKERPEEKPNPELEQLVTRLREAAAESVKEQTLLERLEEDALQRRIGVRQKVAEVEERLRMADRLHDIERERERAEIRALAARLTEPGRNKEDVDRDRAQLDRLESRAREKEKGRTAQRIEARQDLIRVEEKQRQVDRQVALRRKFSEARVEAAEQRVRALEDLARQVQTKARMSPALEKKFDELLRAVQQLRRQLEERRGR